MTTPRKKALKRILKNSNEHVITENDSHAHSESMPSISFLVGYQSWYLFDKEFAWVVG